MGNAARLARTAAVAALVCVLGGASPARLHPLHTTLTVDNVCPGVGEPVTGKADVVPSAGTGGGLQLPIKVDVAWTGLGVTGTGRSQGTYSSGWLGLGG